MSALEFIRKNSLLVLIVVAGVGLGLLMMDYGDRGNMFVKDYYIQVNGTSYSYPETAALGENGQSYVQSLHSTTSSKLRNMFDKNENEELDDTEMAALQAWTTQHPEYDQFIQFLGGIYQSWSYGFADDSAVNVAVNRAVIQAQGEELGISPSKEQIDAYLQAMPVFKKADGSFDQELYQRMTGFRNGAANNQQEKAFRSVIADMMVWEALGNLMTDGLQMHSKSCGNLVDVMNQQLRGKTAWLAKDRLPAPAAATEEEIKAYWEQNKEKYMSDERRIVSIYTLTPGEGSSLDALMGTADIIMQELSQANGKGFDKKLAAAAENPENEAFTYLNAEGKSHVTYPLCSMADAPEALRTQVEHNGNSVSLADIAFKEVDSAPAVAEFEAAQAAGTADDLATIRQVRGYFPTSNGKLAFLRVEAIEQPTVLPYEQAREAAAADLQAERVTNALSDAAGKLYETMTAACAEGGIDAAFAKAAEAGAIVEDFGPVGLGISHKGLPMGLEVQALISVPSGKLAPMVTLNGGARITGVTGRTVETSPQYAAMKSFMHIPSMNARLRGNVLIDWLHDAYTRYSVRLSEHIKLNNQ
ncbi:MAG: peptidylprolyl isomerase [Akkermansia sp.]|nr:peptidylprolyl isomerase [Akkermansia sp.]MBR2314295.1 peptidylprolyl isomerase [Akkermansia sp.]